MKKYMGAYCESVFVLMSIVRVCVCVCERDLFTIDSDLLEGLEGLKVESVSNTGIETTKGTRLESTKPSTDDSMGLKVAKYILAYAACPHGKTSVQGENIWTMT